MTVQNNLPTIKPSLLLDFANTKLLDPRITFTRASTGTYYDGKTVAKAEENLLLQSQDFNTASYTKLRITVGANADTAPDGTTTAESLTQNSGQTTSGNVSQSVSVSSGSVTVSVFAKPNAKNFLIIREGLLDGTTNDTWFDVSTGTIGTTDAGHTATITASLNSYYRCTITFTANAARTGGINFFVADNNGSLSVVDSGGLYLWGAQLEQRSSVTAYTPTTTQAITNYIPQLLTAAAGVARFDHNPTTGESLGLLVEEQRTNLVLRSEEFDNAAWTKIASSITANTVTAPYGTTTADKLVEDTANATHSVSQFNPVSGTTYAVSIYAKAAERSRITISGGGFGAQGFSVTFDLLNGTIPLNTGNKGIISSVGNGWYRCSISFTASSTVSFAFSLVDNSNNATYTGDGYSGIYIWGAQIEAGAFLTSYIPTAAAQVTRSADSASMTGTNFSSWFRADEGTLYMEAVPRTLAIASGIVINDNTANNRIRLATASVTDQGTVTVSGTDQAVLDGGTPVIDTSMRIAMAYKANDFALSLGSGVVATDTSGTVPIVSQLQIGAAATSTGNLTIKKVAYYPRRVTNTQLQAITTV